MSQTSFSSLNLQAPLLDNLVTLNYALMTPIQAESLPHILAGKDVIAQAKTGSGKTAAFGLGLLEKLVVSNYHVQALVLCPTRELADQVAKELRKLARNIHNIKILTLCGGTPFGPQIASLAHGAHIIVGTPGRVEEHLRKNNLDLENLTNFTLDEADRMLDMGFQATLDAIISHTPDTRQTLLFSATFPSQIQSMAQRMMKQPVMIKVDASHDEHSIQQTFYKIDEASYQSSGPYKISAITARAMALRSLLLHHRPGSTLVFCNTKKETQEVADELTEHGFSVAALHGDLEQKVRDQTLVRFANQSISVLVATDVAARGLDIDNLDAVINYQIARDLEVHVHRIGRTGRAGRQGLACTLYTNKEDYKFNSLAEYLQQELVTSPLPDSKILSQPAFKPPMATLQIDGGKKQKIRPGDILGALTGENGISGDEVGKIHLFDRWAYVAVKRSAAATALSKISHGKLKGRSFRARQL